MTQRFRCLVLFPLGAGWAAPPSASAAPAAATPAPTYPGQREGDDVVNDFSFESGAKLPEMSFLAPSLGGELFGPGQRLRLVLGTSMGGLQSGSWGERYRERELPRVKNVRFVTVPASAKSRGHQTLAVAAL